MVERLRGIGLTSDDNGSDNVAILSQVCYHALMRTRAPSELPYISHACTQLNSSTRRTSPRTCLRGWCMVTWERISVAMR
jgi:hypothetical protein